MPLPYDSLPGLLIWNLVNRRYTISVIYHSKPYNATYEPHVLLIKK